MHEVWMGGTADQYMLRRVRGGHHRNGRGGIMSADLNTVTLVGRLTRDPERKDVGSTRSTATPWKFVVHVVFVSDVLLCIGSGCFGKINVSQHHHLQCSVHQQFGWMWNYEGQKSHT